MEKVSVVITVLNEEKSIKALLKSLISQSKKAEEIIVIDGGSKDNTVKIIKEFQNNVENINLIERPSSRSQGRNIGVDASQSEIIAMTDADCIADKDWLQKITKPFRDPAVDIIAGFYKMVTETSFQKALSKYLGTTDRSFNRNFLPSTRSIAFKKSIWKKIGGFPGGKENTGEDSLFNLLAVKHKANFVQAKDAVVFWKIPSTLPASIKKFFSYAKWDARKNSLWHPTQKLKTHNLKIISIYIRYFLFFLLLFRYSSNSIFFLTMLVVYSIWAFCKTFIIATYNSKKSQFHPIKVGLWGIVIQFSSDLAVMAGALVGFLQRFIFKL